MATLDDFEIWSKNLYCFWRGTNHNLYLSDTANLSAEDINVAGADFLNDKSRLRERIPTKWLLEEYGTIDAGVVSTFSNSPRSINELLKSRDSFVIKAVDASSAEHLHFVHSEADPSDRDAIIHEAFKDSKDHVMLVSEFAEQHEYAARVWPHGSNSLRFLVYSMPGQPSRITACVQKWASKHSGLADNWNKGGFTTTVVNGTMLDTMEDFTSIPDRGGNGSSRDPMFSGIPTRFVGHPESGKHISGTQIPFWDEMVGIVLESSEILRDELPWIGWDIIVTKDGPKIIEGNPWPGIQLIQVHFPLLGDPHLREFMEHHNVSGL